MKKKPRIGRKPAKHEQPTRPTVAEVDLKAIEFNVKGIRAKVGRNVGIMAVVKANAYGHGLEQVAKFLEPSLADSLGVAFAEEGLALRKAGIRKPIHVLTLSSERQAPLIAMHGLEASVCTPADIRLLDIAGTKLRKTIPVHLKVETGMNRIGVRSSGFKEVLGELGKARRVALKGIFTHFATADDRDKSFLRLQLEEFQRALEDLKRHKVEAEIIHCANSAAILDSPESYFNTVRPGVMMYGYYPSHTTTESIPVRPALTLRTAVSLVKWIEPGETVSYGRRFTASKRTKIATLPVGYADGVTRLLSGKMEVLIQGIRFPVVGTIGMDQMMVDVGDADVEAGDEAVLLGRQGDRSVTAWDLAEKIGTIPYELLCMISSRVPRVYLS